MARGLSSVEGSHHPKAHIDGAFKKLASVVAGAPNSSRAAQDSLAKSHHVALRKAIYREARDILSRKRRDSRQPDRRWKLLDICDAISSATRITRRTYRIVECWKEAVEDTRNSHNSEIVNTPAISSTAPAPVDKTQHETSSALVENEVTPAEMLQTCMDAVFAELRKTGGVWNGKTESVLQLCQNIGSALSHLTDMCTTDLNMISGVGSLLESTSSNLATMLGNLKNEMSKIQAVLKEAEDARLAAEAEAAARAEAAKAQAQLQADRFAVRKERRRAAEAQREWEREQEEAQREEMQAAADAASKAAVANKVEDQSYALRQTILVIEQLERMEEQLLKSASENSCSTSCSGELGTTDAAIPPPKNSAESQIRSRDSTSPKSTSSTRMKSGLAQSTEQRDVVGVGTALALQQPRSQNAEDLSPSSDNELSFPIAIEITKQVKGQPSKVTSGNAPSEKKAEHSKHGDVTDSTSVAKVATPARTMLPEGHRCSPTTSPYEQLCSTAAQVFEKTMSATKNTSTPHVHTQNIESSATQESLDVLASTTGPSNPVFASNAKSVAPPSASAPAGNGLAAKGWHRVKMPVSSSIEATSRAQTQRPRPVFDTSAFSGWPSEGDAASIVEDTWHNRHLCSGRAVPSSESHVFTNVESGNSTSSTGPLYQVNRSDQCYHAAQRDVLVASRQHSDIPQSAREARLKPKGAPVGHSRRQSERFPMNQETPLMALTRRPSHQAEMPHLRAPLTAREPLPPPDDSNSIALRDAPRSALSQRRLSQDPDMQPRIEKRVRFCAPQSASCLSSLAEPQSPQRLPPLTGATAALGLLGRASEKMSSSSPMTAWQNFMAAGSNFL